MPTATISKPSILLGSIAMALALAGCAASPQHADDPWYSWNRGTQSFNDQLDKFILKPLAQGYEWVTPSFVDHGVTNLFSNINDIGVTVNDMLQFKMLQSGMDMSRFIINTTAGVGGLVDVADMVDLPKHNEDFGQTLGYWGVPSGPYLVLPIFGLSNPRDTLGRVGDALLNPLTYVSFISPTASAAAAGSKVVEVTDTRADLLGTEKVVNEAAVNRYDFLKNAYKQRRDYLVNDGNVADDLDLDENFNTPPPSSSPAKTSTETSPTTATTAPASAPDSSHHMLNLSAPEAETK